MALTLIEFRKVAIEYAGLEPSEIYNGYDGDECFSFDTEDKAYEVFQS